MADHGILFTKPMVDGIIADRKDQTRRLAKFVQPQENGFWHVRTAHGGIVNCDDAAVRESGPDYAPYQLGDRLWVRETYYQRGDWIEDPTTMTKVRGVPKWCFRPIDDEITFEAPAGFRTGWQAGPAEGMYRRLGRFMPRRYSRISLIITKVRVERLQAISEADAIAEGAIRSMEDTLPGYPQESVWTHGQASDLGCGFVSALASYRNLWDNINGSGSWAENPWVVAYNFKRES